MSGYGDRPNKLLGLNISTDTLIPLLASNTDFYNRPYPDACMDRSMPSRRTLLCVGSAGVVTTLAGCLGGDDADDTGDDGSQNGDDGSQNGDDGSQNGDDGSQNGDDIVSEFSLAGDGAETYRDWILPPMDTDESVFICEYLDFETAAQADVEAYEPIRTDTADIFETPPENIAGELVVPIPEGQGSALIHFGEFEPETVIEAIRADEESVIGEHRGYSVLGVSSDEGETPTAAVGSDAVLETFLAIDHLDAVAGETESLGAVDDDASLLFELLPAGIRTGVRYHPSLDDVSISGEVRTAYDNGNHTESIRAFIFESESDASVERVAELIDESAAEIHTEEQYGRVVMVEYSV